MKGGDEPPCINRAHLPEYEEKRGRPCPFVDLAPQNARAAELLTYLLDERLRPVAPVLFQLTTAWMPADERLALLQRVAGAARDNDVMKMLYPEREKS